MTSTPQAPLFQKPEEVASAGLARLGIFGDNGSGKTTFLASIPPSIPTLVVSADDENVDPLRGLEHVRVVKATEWDQLRSVLYFLAKEQHPFRCVAFDTWSRMQALAINQVTGYKPRDAEEAMRYITQIPRTPQGFQQWQNIGALAAEWMRYFERLPMHTVFLFQLQLRKEDRENQDDEGKFGPALTPWALRAAKEALKMIGYLYVDIESPNGQVTDINAALDAAKRPTHDINPGAKEVRRLLIGQHPRYTTKGPTHKVGYVIENPTWERVAPAWES